MSEKSSVKSLPHKQSKLSFKRKFDDIKNSTETEAQASEKNLKIRRINDQIREDGEIVSISLNNTSNRDDDLNTTNKEISLVDSPSPIPSPVSTDSTSCQDSKDNHDNDNSRKEEEKINENKQESDKNNNTKDSKLSKEDKELSEDLRIKYLRKYQFMSYDLETKLLYCKLCRDFSKDNVLRFGKQ